MSRRESRARRLRIIERTPRSAKSSQVLDDGRPAGGLGNSLRVHGGPWDECGRVGDESIESLIRPSTAQSGHGLGIAKPPFRSHSSVGDPPQVGTDALGRVIPGLMTTRTSTREKELSVVRCGARLQRNQAGVIGPEDDSSVMPFDDVADALADGDGLHEYRTSVLESDPLKGLVDQ